MTDQTHIRNVTARVRRGWPLLLSGLFMLLGYNGQGQPEKVKEAFVAYQDGDLDAAKKAIDQAAEHPETKDEGNTWYLRGFVYSEYYTQREFSNPHSEMRKKSAEFFIKALQMNLDEKRRKSCTSRLKYIASTHYNDVVKMLTPEHYNTAIVNFERYAQLVRIADTTVNIKVNRIEFLLALASLYTRIYDSNQQQNEEFWTKARDCYNQVFEIEEKNIQANYNMGILYYNKAVYIISGSDYDLDMVAINEIQDTCVVLFKQSLPYMQTAYELQPGNINTLMGLSGIFFGLNEVEKSNALQKEILKLREQNK